MEAKRRGAAAQGDEEIRLSRTCHLGRKPRKGGRPARDRKDRDRIVFCEGGREVSEMIFEEVMECGARENIIVKVVRV